MKTKSTAIAVIAAVAGIGLAGCGGHTPESSQASESKKAPVAVRVVTAATMDTPSIYEASGTVRARMAAQISTRVMAYVREVRAKVGDRVREGQVLAVLDSRDAEVRVRQAEAAQSEARNAAIEAEQGVASAKANLELAEATYSRMKDLFEKTSISRQEFDEATARVRMARAAVEMAAARRAQVGSKIQQAEEERHGASIMQGYSTITAPFSGIITEKTVEPGNLAVPGAPLMTVERGGDYRLEANIDESMVGRFRLGQSVEVEVEAIGQQLTGRVSEIVPAVDPAARSSTVKIDVPQVSGLRTGLFGRARFTTGSKRAMTAPASAVGERGQVQWVFVADNGVARSRLITTGERTGDRVQILSGLAENERVIAPAPAGLADGDRIEVRQ